MEVSTYVMRYKSLQVVGYKPKEGTEMGFIDIIEAAFYAAGAIIEFVFYRVLKFATGRK